jgi:tetratricopeptide (TPR) repeat protein
MIIEEAPLDVIGHHFFKYLSALKIMEPGISLCMIVKDEQENLRKVLESIRELVDEIIIVDTGSTDKTKEIAFGFTDKVFDFSWSKNFSEARNFSISKASKFWILVLDADEIISKKDFAKIKDAAKEDADAFLFTLRDYTNDIGVAGFTSSKEDVYEEGNIAAGFYTAKILRFFKNKKEYFFQGKIHETIHNSIKKAGGKISELDCVIHHFGNLDKDKFLKKKDTYMNLLKERLEKKDVIEKEEDYVCFELSRELINLGKIEEAIFFLEKAISTNEDFKYLLSLGGLYILKNKLNEAEKTLKKAIILEPASSSVHDNLGVVYAKKGEYNKAIRKFEKAIQLNPKSADAYFNLGLAYRETGKTNKMDLYFNKAIELNPIYKNKIETS